jgi:DNA-directed RNA polymerase specialized sigma24 family protein
MTINEIITNHYDELHAYCSSDKVISLSKTEEDILQDVLVTAMKKFKDKEITEREGMDYLKLTLYNEQLFQKARLKKDKLTFVENIESYDKDDGK